MQLINVPAVLETTIMVQAEIIDARVIAMVLEIAIMQIIVKIAML